MDQWVKKGKVYAENQIRWEQSQPFVSGINELTHLVKARLLLQPDKNMAVNAPTIGTTRDTFY